jgi:WhiB family redox-sensing transcriptional regulator
MTHADAHPPLAWQTDAACTTSDPDRWFPANGASDWVARAICADCPVAAMCLEYALDNGEEWGTWGGKNGAELKRLRVQREQERRT